MTTARPLLYDRLKKLYFACYDFLT